MTPEDHAKACDALQTWCQSQDLIPADAMMICELFIARLIITNATSSENLEKKIRLCDSAIRAQCAKIILEHP